MVGADGSHGLQGSIASLQSTGDSQASAISLLQASVANAADVLALEPYVKVSSSAINGVAGPNIVFTGANVEVRSATSETDTTGTGNLIVGWDDAPPSTVSGYRSGSNNLVCGDGNSFFSYAGFLAGLNNTASGQWDSICGEANAATSISDCVSGCYNTASGDGACINGGTASGEFATVSGGTSNTAGGGCATVGGGEIVSETTYCGWSAGGSLHNP